MPDKIKIKDGKDYLEETKTITIITDKYCIEEEIKVIESRAIEDKNRLEELKDKLKMFK